MFDFQVDFTFGTWIPYCFDETGTLHAWTYLMTYYLIFLSNILGGYVRKDLNMPLSVPKRQGSPESFFKDCPLTILGETQAGLLGQALRIAGVSTIQHVYCSPSLRSLQTCHNILKGLEVEHSVPICLEPGLFEWLAWYQDSMPQFLTPSEMRDAGFRLHDQHQYFIDFNELSDRRESAEQYYMRSHYVTQCALRCTEHIGKIKITSGTRQCINTPSIFICQEETFFWLDMLQHLTRVRDNWLGDHHVPPKSSPGLSIESLTAVWQLSSSQKICRLMNQLMTSRLAGNWLSLPSHQWLTLPIYVSTGRRCFLN